METEKKNYIRRSDLFLANTVHELRTPVQTIIGTLDLLSDTKLNTEQTEYVKQLKFSSEVLLSLVNDILDFAKLHTDQISIEEISFNPILLLENTASLVSLDASEKGIELFTDIDYSLYPEISGDPTRIRQIILNLLKNAVKFTEKGYVKIKMQKISDFLEFSVTDTGIGIKPEYKEKLFTNFWQGDPSITRKYGGTGLGLSICKSLITKMNGEIYVNDNPDGGSIFTFTIPYKPTKIITKKIYPLDFKIKKILIVDGNSIVTENLKNKLSYLNLTDITTTTDCSNAIQIIKEHNQKNTPFDCIFINSKLRSQDGWSLASQIRNNLGLKKIKLFLMTYKGTIGQDAKIKILNWFNGFIYKPIQMENLYFTLKEAESGKTTSLKKILSERAEENFSFSKKSEIALGLKILVAEDHPVNRRLLKTFLIQFGAEVIEAENGMEAVKKAENTKDLNIIFMDIQMPILSGTEASEMIRKKNSDVIIIASSALNDKKTAEEFKNKGINDILPKPFKRDDVKKILEKWKSVIFLPELKESTSQTIQEENILWNISDFEDTIGNDKTLGFQILFDFQDQSEQLIENAFKSLSKKDFTELRTISHTLEGSSSAISATKLIELSRKMNAFAKEKDSEKVQYALEELKNAYNNFCTLSEKWKNELL